MKISILGAGRVGHRLAILANAARHEVVVGLRDPAKAAASSWRHTTFSDAAASGEIVIIAIPFLACIEALSPCADALGGKIVVDATNPLKPNWSPVLLGQENSAGEEIARLLPRSRVVKAFNTIFADIMTISKLDREGRPATLFLCGDDAGARAAVSEFAESLGFAPVDAGPLRCARYLEAMAHLNIQLAVGQGGGTDAAFLYHRNADEDPVRASSSRQQSLRPAHVRCRTSGPCI